MKQYIYSILGFMLFMPAYSQPSPNDNYIQTKTYTNELGTVSMDVIQYFDGLGRPIETVQKQASPRYADIISYQDYDSYGRESNAWLPVVTDDLGNYGAFVSRNQVVNVFSPMTYDDDREAFSSSVYESSPLNRVVKQFGPGEDWHRRIKGVSYEYLTNIEDGPNLVCLLYRILNGNIGRIDFYDDNQLFVTKIKDEDDNLSYEFKDKLGQVVLTRQINKVNGKDEYHDTYYVYDDFGNLCYVLPPLAKAGADDSENMKQYAYLYKYDDRNRCIAKRLPGCDWIYYVYDKADQLILSQDGEQRKDNEWTFSANDKFGRLVFSGQYKDPNKRTHQQFIDKFKDIVLQESTGGWFYGYTINLFNMMGPYQRCNGIASDVKLVNYYDNYDYFSGHFTQETIQKEAKPFGFTGEEYSSAKGLLTGTLTFYDELGGNGDPCWPDYKYLVSVMRYDERGRLIQAKSTNHMGGIEKEFIDYNFTGQPTQKLHEHTISSGSSVKELYTYQYDHAGRLITITHKLNDKPEVILAQNTYDELGRLQKTKANNDQQLETTYTYNVRSWVNSIKSPLFSEILSYNELVSNKEYGGSFNEAYNKPCYNGNISKVYSEGANYNLYYDNLSRLTGAGYMISRLGTKRGITYSTSYEYGKHGNVTNLIRYGQKNSSPQFCDLVDNLQISYNGNQLYNVSESAEDPTLSTSYDFKDYSNGNGSYIYNKNGAMVTDPSKGVTTTYDHNNMPKKIRVDNPITKGDIEYIYSASGQKLQTTYYTDRKIAIKPRPTIPGVEVGTRNGVTVSKLRELSEIIDYTGNKVYKTHKVRLRNVTELDKILIDNGYIQDGIYYFYQKDHLGNNRIVANQNGEVVQRNNYYPFGMPFGGDDDNEVQPYKFGGKEFDTMHGLNLYDVHARQYDAATIRFTTVDPLAEKYYSISPYVYCLNNPLKYTDPTGMWIEDENGDLIAEDGDNQNTLAKYLNTTSDIALSMMTEQLLGISAKEDGSDEGGVKEGDFLIIGGDRYGTGKIGGNGEFPQNYAGSRFSKDMFANYWKGHGDVELTGQRFADILLYLKKIGISPKTGGGAHGVSFYNSAEYGLVFGTATVYYDTDGKIIGFHDDYDFNSQAWGNRSYGAEIKTRLVSIYSILSSKAKDFKITYGKNE